MSVAGSSGLPVIGLHLLKNVTHRRTTKDCQGHYFCMKLAHRTVGPRVNASSVAPLLSLLGGKTTHKVVMQCLFAGYMLLVKACLVAAIT